jgi:serine phosphatase RsbU (regulator of sigma subunit)/predicted negative regulator of RcsB-dependent stress response
MIKEQIKYVVLIVYMAYMVNPCVAQNRKVDSLQNIFNKTTQDTARLRVYIQLGFACDVTDNLKYSEPAIQLADKILTTITDTAEQKKILRFKIRAIHISWTYYTQDKSDTANLFACTRRITAIYKQMNDTLGVTFSLLQMANDYKTIGDYPKAMEYCQEGLALAQSKQYKKYVSSSFYTLGDLYAEQGDTVQAFENYQNGLSILYQLKDTNAAAYNLISMGMMYGKFHDTTKALECFRTSILLSEKKKVKSNIRRAYDGLGLMYSGMGNFEKAKVNYEKSLVISEALQSTNNNENDWLCVLLSNIGNIYIKQDSTSKALEYYFRSLNISEKSGYNNRTATNFIYISRAYVKQKDLHKANLYVDSALERSKNRTILKDVRDEEALAAQIDSATGNYKGAYEHYQQYIIIRDKLNSDEVRKAASKERFQSEYTRQKAIDKVEQDKKDTIAEDDRRKQRVITWSIAGGLLLMFVFAGYIFRSLYITRKQKSLIERQKLAVEQQKQLVEEKSKIVEEKNKDILDSITYAKRLQDAILPPLSMVEKYLPESFVLYKPKDIVAGDFYWMERVGDNILIAAADCTGHGVPGALVSVVCSNALNRTVKEFKITEPGKILDKVRELVLETFEKSESNVQDGMDISLAAISRKLLVDSAEIQWAGAFNSLWYMQNGEMKELAADKQPIGKTDKPLPFTTHNIELGKGDSLYLFTDGYADQFGGPKGKKFKYKAMQEKLLAISHQQMAEQKSILNKTIEDWKGNLEQVDDVLIIGIRV